MNRVIGHTFCPASIFARNLPMSCLRFSGALLALLLLLGTLPAQAEETTADLGIQVPEGFEVSLYADDSLAHDIYSMTIDAQGRVVVAGPNYVKTLIDSNADGRADRFTLYSTLPASGAHGMFFDGPDLICTGDNAVMRQRDRDGDGQADGKPEVWAALRNPEHGANGLVRGPDGCFYLICGNDAGISEKLVVSPGSPVKHPRSGGVVRFGADGKPLDVYAHGFRNPYDLDFDAQGHLLTVDSDGERDHHLPWYAPTRLFDIAQGREHGWLLSGWARSWNRPESFYDNVQRVANIGRGSPTGLVVYRHNAFPAHYRGGVFAACWTFGRVYYFPLEAADASCRTRQDTFMQTKGDVGFAPCDLAVGPAGDLFVAIGGRRTRGSVFRVRYIGNGKGNGGGSVAGSVATTDPLQKVLNAPQSQSSWSRAAWVPAAQSLGRTPFDIALEDNALPVSSRIRAIEILVELFGGLDLQNTDKSIATKSPEVRARLAWALGRGPASPTAQRLLAMLTGDEEPAVQRFAWEALATGQEIDATSNAQPDWSRGLSSPLRRVRSAAIAVAQSTGAQSYQTYLSRVRIAATAYPLRLAQLWVKLPDVPKDRQGVLTAADVETCLAAFTATDATVENRLEALRLLIIAAGDLQVGEGQVEVYSGYLSQHGLPAGSDTAALRKKLSEAFPSSDPELNRELARVLGMLRIEDPSLLANVSRQWTDTSSVEDDIHYLIVASLLGGPRDAEMTNATARALLSLQKKLDDANQFASRNWPFRVGETVDALMAKDPTLAAGLVISPLFNHADHTLFISHLPKEMQPAATRKLWSATVKENDEATPDLIAGVGRLPADEARTLLKSQKDHPGVSDAVVMALAKHPHADDRARFVEALGSPQPAVVEKAAGALLNLGIDSTAAEIAAALRALKQACALEKQEETRRAVLRLLSYWTEENSDVEDNPDPKKTWVGWYQMFAWYYPAEAARLQASSGADVATWKNRLSQVNWSSGDAAAGRVVFERRACHRCHEVSGHLGPELKGAVTRMSREDLFTAIIDPNLEVSPAYHTSVVATNAGQVYHGLVVYESPEGLLLQTGPDTTARIMNTETSSLRRSPQSLMPTGLLDPLSDQELSDLYAYLKSLGKK